MFEHDGIGRLYRLSGARGGTDYIPHFELVTSKALLPQVCKQLEDPQRILPGGYVYMSDLLGNPEFVREVGKAFVTAFANQEIDAVVTVETKGIPIAYAI